MRISLDDRVAIVTGAGQGLGRAYALALSERGAKVVVNDLAAENAAAVVNEIRLAGGQAIGVAASVTDVGQIKGMVAKVMETWGRVDILINNAGILRDKSFLKMSIEDFRLVVDVHLMGSVNCTKTVWGIMRDQEYGRVVFTTSSSGLYGIFGQANYGAAKMAMLGLMNTLHLEGAKYNIAVNCLAPTAGTAMTDGLFTDDMFERLTPESVSPGVVFLASSAAPSRTVLCAGGGNFAVYKGFETEGVCFSPEMLSAETLASSFQDIANEDGMRVLHNGYQQSEKFAAKCAGNDD